MIVDKELMEYFLDLINELDKEDKIAYAMVSFMPHSIHCRLLVKDGVQEIKDKIKDRFKNEIITIKEDSYILQITVIRKKLVKIKV